MRWSTVKTPRVPSSTSSRKTPTVHASKLGSGRTKEPRSSLRPPPSRSPPSRREKKEAGKKRSGGIISLVSSASDGPRAPKSPAAIAASE